MVAYANFETDDLLAGGASSGTSPRMYCDIWWSHAVPQPSPIAAPHIASMRRSSILLTRTEIMALACESRWARKSSGQWRWAPRRKQSAEQGPCVRLALSSATLSSSEQRQQVLCAGLALGRAALGSEQSREQDPRARLALSWAALGQRIERKDTKEPTIVNK